MKNKILKVIVSTSLVPFKTLVKTFLLTLALMQVLTPSLLLASDGGSHGIESLTWYYINSGLFFGVLFLILRKPCKKYFASRREVIISNVDEASKALEDAQKALANAKRKHEFLEEELGKIRDEIIDEANEQANHIINMATEKAEYLKSMSKKMIEAEEKKALKNLNAAFGKILIEDTTNDIKSSLSAENDNELILKKINESMLT
ncbi:MAG: hypothetical protein ACOX3T_06265 [Bdellovibrionota bacterium]